MAVQITFDEFVSLPENADKLFEFIGGQITEVPSNPYSSQLATRISTYVGLYLLKHPLGHLTGESGGYMVSGERYAPDVAYISKERQPELAKEGYNPNPPNLAVEVVSPSDREDLLRIKIANYLAAGTLVWLVRPPDHKVEVYTPGRPVKIVDLNGTLDGDSVLPGFTLSVKDIFGA